MTINSQGWSLILVLEPLFAYYLFNGRKRKKIRKDVSELNEEDNDINKWNQALIPEVIILFPLIAFTLTFLKINNDKSIIDFIEFLAMGGLLVFGGIFLNYLLSRSK